MLRTWLTPRWLALSVLLVLVVVTFSWLGLWQLGVAQKAKKADIGSGPNLPRAQLTTVVKPGDKFPDNGSLRKVFTTGRYVPADQMLVSGRLLGKQHGYWVVTGFRVDGANAVLAVVRGFVADPKQATRAPDAPTRLEGALAPGESPSDISTPPGQLTSVDLPRLMQAWNGEVYNAFVFMTSETPKATTAPISTFPPPRAASSGLQLRNFGYALQWWVFAIFAIYMFCRQLRDEAEVSRLLAAHERHPDDEGELTT